MFLNGSRRTFCFVMVFLTAVVVSAVQEEPLRGGNYHLGPGDVLDIVVWQNSELSRSVPIRPDGWISLPLLNDVRAAGLTPMELQERLTVRLSEYISAPTVSVIVTDVNAFKVSVLGEVKSPGRYEFDGPATVLDALALAGGFTEFASKDDTYVLRPTGTSYDRIAVRYSRVGREGESVNIGLEPGDILIVP